MTDFRALCAKMAEDIRYLSECLRSPDDGHDPICLSECESDYQEARTALAQPAPPAEGEVAELVAWLREEADDWSQANPRGYQGERLARAADLLEQRHPAPPAEGEVTDEELLGAYHMAYQCAWAASSPALNQGQALRLQEIAGIHAAIALDRSRRAPVQAAEITEDQREAVKTAVADAIGLFAYDCTRSWEAWSVGTMGQDDFVLIVEDDARVTEIADAAIAALLHPPQPAEGEVGELVAFLRGCADGHYGHGRRGRLMLTRAADLLEQRHPAPVPVSERLPGAEDCAPWPNDPDTQPWCWLGNVVDGGWEWHQRSPGILTFIRDSYTHWLPSHALPLPAGGVQP